MAKKTIIYDKRHPWGPFLHHVFFLMTIILVLLTISFIVMVFYGEWLFLLFSLLCASLVYPCYKTPFWIEKAVISNYDRKHK